MLRHLLSLVALALCLSSCAYMQSHKNVEEAERRYDGHQLNTPAMVYQKGGQWFLGAQPATFRRHFPLVHDSVFQGQTESEMRLVGEPAATLAYHPISAGTATILRREDGYADLQTLADELNAQPGAWRDKLPGATAYPIRAQIVGKPTALTGQGSPEEASFGTRLLSGLVFTFVDIPGTLVYNVAIPFAAPVVFFRDFLSED